MCKIADTIDELVDLGVGFRHFRNDAFNGEYCRKTHVFEIHIDQKETQAVMRDTGTGLYDVIGYIRNSGHVVQELEAVLQQAIDKVKELDKEE